MLVMMMSAVTPPPRTDMMNLVDDDYLVERNDGFYSLNS